MTEIRDIIVYGNEIVYLAKNIPNGKVRKP